MPLVPIGHYVCATLTALLAAHSQTKRGHEQTVIVGVNVHDSFVPAGDIRAMDKQRPHAIGAHVAEVHGLNFWHGVREN